MDTKYKSVMVHPSGFQGGELRMPGDRSLSHIAVMLASMASGTSIIKNFAHADENLSTLRAMETLGARSGFDETDALHIQGTAGRFIEPVAPIDFGGDGIGLRLVAGIAAGLPITVHLTGGEVLRERPLEHFRDALTRMGAQVEVPSSDGLALMRIHGGALHGTDYTPPIASALLESSVLMAGLFAEGITTIRSPACTRDHTERALKRLGVSIEYNSRRIKLTGAGPGLPALRACEWNLPGDFSLAACWIAAAAATPGVELILRGVGLNPRRTALIDILKRMGANLSLQPTPHIEEPEEPVGDIIVSGQELKATNIKASEIPLVVDEIPALALAAACARGTSRITFGPADVMKESRWIESVLENLRGLGIAAQISADSVSITGVEQPRLCVEAIRCVSDHRVIAAMALLAARANQPVCISNIGPLDMTYAGFWDDLHAMGVRVE